MRATAILETALYADDLETAERFYHDVLGLEVIVRVPDRHVFFRLGDSVLLVFRPAATLVPPAGGALPVPPHGAEGPGHACFRASAAELDPWARHLAAHGVEIEARVDWPQGGRSIYFRDPAGNSLEFAEPRIWGLD